MAVVFAETPEPPYVAVIFTSVRSETDEDGYSATAEAMGSLATEQPGYLGIESARNDGSRLGITVSYWATEDDARAWKQVSDHLGAQRLGRERWYSGYVTRIAVVGRDYRFDGA